MSISSRRAEIAANLARVRERIAAACAAAGRDPAEITLVAVTKTYPASDVAHLAALGVHDIGENRDQEASAKAVEVAAAGVDVRWHFVGQLQRNKCRSVVGYAAMVHSVDRRPLVEALGAARQRLRESRPLSGLDVLVQISLDSPDAAGRAGATVADVPAIASAVDAHPALRLAGVMSVAPLGVDPTVAFTTLARVAADVRRKYPDATVISAGMSADLEAAIACGATHVRIGSALLGERGSLR
jgi:pyridoxal phosphate enzyme (YggS family)